MSSTNAAAVKDEVLLVPERKLLPGSFVDALKQGWKFAHETTTLAIDNHHRDGTLTLTRPGFSKLSVPYTASAKKGYTFGKPRLA
jgi:hypothetical protein